MVRTPRLEWLGSYSGETVDELISFEGRYRIDSLVLVIEQALDQKSARDGDSLTAPERVILAVEALEREVNNGGYSQFFINSSREYAPLITDSLQLIGCLATAALTQQAIQALRLPRHTMQAIESEMNKEDPRRDAILSELDAQYFKTRENIPEKLFSFIKLHKAEIEL